MLLLTVPNLRCVYLLKWPKTSAHMAGAAQSVAADGLAWPKSKHESQLIMRRCNEKWRTISYDLFDKAMMSQLFGGIKLP